MVKSNGLDKPSKDQVLPLSFPFNLPLKKSRGSVLAGDIGGTKTRLALFTLEGDQLNLNQQTTYDTGQFNSFKQAFEAFYKEGMPEVEGVCLGVAGPVVDGKVQGTNFPWKLEINEIKQLFTTDSVFLMNDMEAGAYGLGTLKKEDLKVINRGASSGGNAALISPGTGLGEVGLFFDGTEYRPFATEGGHCDFSPRSLQECSLWKYMYEKFGHVSWERLVSGPGIIHIYEFLKGPDHISSEIAKAYDPGIISSRALERSCALSMETMDLFFKFLAVECAQLALKYKAGGGIFIGGGIIPKVFSGLDKTTFCQHFNQAGRLSGFLGQIPVFAVMQEDTPLRGAALYACAGLSDHKVSRYG